MKLRSMLLAMAFIAGTLPSLADIHIVAAENFYGGVAAQIAGSDAKVVSILSNPNQDPHEFTSDAATAKAVAEADIVIYNGLGYDGWMDKLLGIAGKKDRVVIRVADLIGAKYGDNPHIWYDPRTMSALAEKLAEVIFTKAYDASFRNAAGANPFGGRVHTFEDSLQIVVKRVAQIRLQKGGIAVTATEPVFGYMANALGFKMLNYDFQINVMNDTEPSALQTASFEKSLRSHTAKLLFYNSQVTDPTTDRLKKIAQQNGVPIVGVTETQPAEFKTYAEWMSHELDAVQAGLKSSPR